MDPITHGIVGAALSSFSGETISLLNPLTIGGALGAMAPDLDVVVRFYKDDAYYMEHHRGISHSLPFLAAYSVAIAGALSLTGFGGTHGFLSILLWTFIGALSHTGMDILNAYGARLLKKRRKGNLLTLYDPVLTILSVFLIWRGHSSKTELAGIALGVLAYLLLRLSIKRRAQVAVWDYFDARYETVEVHVLPSLKAFYKWDFVVHTETYDIVGQYNPWRRRRKFKIIRKLPLGSAEDHAAFMASTVGEMFSAFSPNIHVERLPGNAPDGRITLRAVDLRFVMRREFMHHATLVLDANMNPVSAHIHPYSLDKAVPIAV